MSFIISEEYLNNDEVIDSFKVIGAQVSKNVFNNRLVRVQFCDETFKVLKTVN